MNLPQRIASTQYQIVRELLIWFESNKREFPWRQGASPFAILVAEKLLQQTRARALVVDIYELFLDKYPSPERLAEADVNELRIIISPLRLKYRANELKAMAAQIVEIHDSLVPSNLDELKDLTGVGDYCARAVLCFAFNKRISVVDVNIARWLHRLCGIDKSLPANPARKKYLYKLADALMPENNIRIYNLAILDLCSLICKVRNPDCSRCPIKSYCTYV